MAIQDTDYFLVEDTLGGSHKVKASKLRANLYCNYAQYKMLVNTDQFVSYSVRCVDVLDKLSSIGGLTYFFLVNRSDVSYRVDSTQFSDYFELPLLAFGQITLVKI